MRLEPLLSDGRSDAREALLVLRGCAGLFEGDRGSVVLDALSECMIPPERHGRLRHPEGPAQVQKKEV